MDERIQRTRDRAQRRIEETMERLDAYAVIAKAAQWQTALLGLQMRASTHRRKAIIQLREDGATLAEVAERTGLSTARISQIEHGRGES